MSELNRRAGERCKEHGETLRYAKGLKPKQPMRRVSQERAPETRKRGSTLKRGRGFTASKVQQEKVKHAACVNCGRDGSEVIIDPAHLWDRGRGGCGHILCVVPLCRSCHDPYDEHKLDLLPRLLTCGLYEEIAHPIRAHGVSPTTLLERVTGIKWIPLEEESDQTKEEAAISGSLERSCT